MIPLVDLHCHLLAGLDDGPVSHEEALAMCRIAFEDGVRFVAATAHQNDRWPQVTPERIRNATRDLSHKLREIGLPLIVFPAAEVMAFPEMLSQWQEGRLLSLADRGQYLLIEMPHGICVDLRQAARELRTVGIRIVLAHPERQPELLHESGRIEELIEEGCLVQVSAESITQSSGRNARALRDWFRRGVVHFLGSDGHSTGKRPPRISEAFQRIAHWAGATIADRVCSTNGLALSQGFALHFVKPQPAPRRMFSWLW